MNRPYVAVACGCQLGETPSWSVREGALYWVDIRAPALHRLVPADGRHTSWPMPELCGAVVPASTGVILALRQAIVHFDPDRNSLTPLVELEPAELDNRLNEAKCDRSGRLWVGSMRDFGAAVTGSLYAIDRDLRQRRVFTDIRIPNGLAWSPDGRTMYFADTGDGALRRYGFDAERGLPGDAGILLASGDAPGRPDGATVDAEGHVWNARPGAGCVLRIAPDGRVVETVALPVSQPTSCCLGGPGLRTLFITTAAQKLSEAQRAEQPEAGHLFAVEVDIPGLPEAEFPYAASAMR